MKRETRLTHNSEVSEKAIEAYLGKLVKEAGGISLKYTNGNASGYPDRLLLLPGGVMGWAEIKSQGETPTKLQATRINKLRRLGFMAWICDSREKAEQIVEQLKRCQKDEV